MSEHPRSVADYLLGGLTPKEYRERERQRAAAAMRARWAQEEAEEERRRLRSPRARLRAAAPHRSAVEPAARGGAINGLLNGRFRVAALLRAEIGPPASDAELRALLKAWLAEADRLPEEAAERLQADIISVLRRHEGELTALERALGPLSVDLLPRVVVGELLATLDAARGARDHRLRLIRDPVVQVPMRFPVDAQVRADYAPLGSGAGLPRLGKQVPVFARNIDHDGDGNAATPPIDERRRLPLQIFVLWDPGAGTPVVPIDPANARERIWRRDLRIIRETYARLGIEVETVQHGPAVVDANNEGVDDDHDYEATDGHDWVRVIDSRTVNDANGNPIQPNNLTMLSQNGTRLGNQLFIAQQFNAANDTIRVFYGGDLPEGQGGNAWASVLDPIFVALGIPGGIGDLEGTAFIRAYPKTPAAR